MIKILIDFYLGYPIMIKASAGGGGKGKLYDSLFPILTTKSNFGKLGMRIAWNDNEAMFVKILNILFRASIHSGIRIKKIISNAIRF